MHNNHFHFHKHHNLFQPLALHHLFKGSLRAMAIAATRQSAGKMAGCLTRCWQLHSRRSSSNRRGLHNSHNSIITSSGRRCYLSLILGWKAGFGRMLLLRSPLPWSGMHSTP